MKLDLRSSNSFNLHSEYKSIHVKNVLESNMERHRLITSQWCKLLTGARGITNNDNDPQGTTVQFTWCEKDLVSNTTQNLSVEGHWCKPVAESEKLAIEACKLQSTERVVPKSTSWIMSWCRQEVTRRRRALMNPTSTTRNEANDFGGENDLTIQGSGWWSWKNGAWMYCSGWDIGELSEWLLLNISATLTMDW